MNVVSGYLCYVSVHTWTFLTTSVSLGFFSLCHFKFNVFTCLLSSVRKYNLVSLWDPVNCVPKSALMPQSSQAKKAAQKNYILPTSFHDLATCLQKSKLSFHTLHQWISFQPLRIWQVLRALRVEMRRTFTTVIISSITSYKELTEFSAQTFPTNDAMEGSPTHLLTWYEQNVNVFFSLTLQVPHMWTLDSVFPQ